MALGARRERTGPLRDPRRRLAAHLRHPHPHRIRIAFPAEDTEHVRHRLFAAAELMECRVLEVTTAAGTPLEAWDAVTDEDE